jgi:hypothetical protein
MFSREEKALKEVLLEDFQLISQLLSKNSKLIRLRNPAPHKDKTRS